MGYVISTPKLEVEAVTSADTEYSMTMPVGTKQFSLQVRDGDAADGFRVAFDTGKVASPVEPYMGLNAGEQYYEENINLQSATIIYFAHSVGSVVVELLTWR